MAAMLEDESRPADKDLIESLVRRYGVPTLVTLNSGPQIVVHNIAWGYDIGDEYAHVTTNISPSVPGASVDFFFTSDVRSIADPARGETLA